MSILDEKYEALNNYYLALVPYRRTIVQILFDKIHSLMGNARLQEIQNNSKSNY